MSEKLQRNDPCHCGSGKKYKNCCMEKDSKKLSSKLGVIGLVVIVLLGLWFWGTAMSNDGGGVPNCPAGQQWSEAHQHCH
ncbi:MAG: SEC-C metal-binding domain-containing protein [Gracilimonas sp.]|nr:SEC-C metal-binding domain-containing protein [Gracilimonas sp.]